MTKRFVLTGPPGSGKTAVVAELRALGRVCIDEPARIVLAEQRRTNGSGVPEKDPRRFLDLMFERMLDDFTTGPDHAIFDRGIPDMVGYAALFGLDPSRYEEAAGTHRYADVVFATPSWPEIYTTDDERKMTFEHADAFGRHVREVYAGLGYTIVDVPRETPEERARFIEGNVK